jgi:hypothetical protein
MCANGGAAACCIHDLYGIGFQKKNKRDGFLDRLKRLTLGSFHPLRRPAGAGFCGRKNDTLSYRFYNTRIETGVARRQVVVFRRGAVLLRRNIVSRP